MKHEYLVELLKANKTVIVPNLGAISNNENPHHPFLFNEYLKFNDGMMAKHIASKEGISMDTAGEMISKFTNELQEILGAGKEVVIPGIGTLVKKDGKLHLNSLFEGAAGIKKPEQVISTPKVEEPKIIPPVISTSSITEKPTLKQVQSDEPKIIPPVVEKPKVEVPKIIPPIVEKKPEPIIERKPEPKIIPPVVEKPKEELPKKEIPPVVEKKSEPKTETLKQVQSDIPVVEKPTLNPETVNPKQETRNKKPKKKRKLVWIILLLLLLGGGGTTGYLYKDELMKLMGMGGDDSTASNDKDKKDSDGKSNEEKTNEENVKTEEPITSDTVAEPIAETVVEEPIKEEPIKVEEVVEDNKTQPITAESSTPGNYYIIVGCFQETTNADNMIAKISATGMTPTNVGTFNGLAHIAAGSASDLSSALQQASSIRGTFAKVWILKR